MKTIFLKQLKINGFELIKIMIKKDLTNSILLFFKKFLFINIENFFEK